MTVMHGNAILPLVGNKAPAAKQRNEGRLRVGRQHQALSASFLSALVAKLSELSAPRATREQLGLPLGSEPSRRGRAEKNSPVVRADDSATVASEQAIAARAGRSAARPGRGLASHIRTAPRRLVVESRFITRHGGRRSNRNLSSSSREIEAQPRAGRAGAWTAVRPFSVSKGAEDQSPAIHKSPRTILNMDRLEGRVAMHSPTKQHRLGRFGAMRRAAHPHVRSLHFNSNAFRQASVGIRRLVPTNKGLTQPHFGPSESRQDSYLPATTSSAARRRLPSKASRFWGRSESHHPSFRALGLPQESDKLTSSLKSSGRLPSLSKLLRAKFELVGKGTTGEAAGREPTVERAESRAKHHRLGTKASARSARKTSAGFGRKNKANSVRSSRERTHLRQAGARAQMEINVGKSAGRRGMKPPVKTGGLTASQAPEANPPQKAQNARASHVAQKPSDHRLPIVGRRQASPVNRPPGRTTAGEIAPRETGNGSKAKKLVAQYSTFEAEADTGGTVVRPSSLNGRPSSAGQRRHEAAPHPAPRNHGDGKTGNERARLGKHELLAELRPKTGQDRDLRQANVRQSGHEADGTSRSRATHAKVPNLNNASGAEGWGKSRGTQNVSHNGFVRAGLRSAPREMQVKHRQAVMWDGLKRPARVEPSPSSSTPAARSGPSQPRPKAGYVRPMQAPAKLGGKRQSLQVEQQVQVGGSKKSAGPAKIGTVAPRALDAESAARASARTGTIHQPARGSAGAAPSVSGVFESGVRDAGRPSQDDSGMRRASTHKVRAAGAGASKNVEGVRGGEPDRSEMNRSASSDLRNSQVRQGDLTVKREFVSRPTSGTDHALKGGRQSSKAVAPSTDRQQSAKPTAPTGDDRGSSRASAATSRANEVGGARTPAASVWPRTAKVDTGSRPVVTSASQLSARSGVSDAPDQEPRLAVRSAPQQDRVVEAASREEHVAPRPDVKGKGSKAKLAVRADTGPDKSAPESKPLQVSDRDDKVLRTHQGKPSEPAHAPGRGLSEQQVDGPGSARLAESHQHVANPTAASELSPASELKDSRSAVREVNGGTKAAAVHQWQEAFANVVPAAQAGKFALGSRSVSAGHQSMISHVAGEIRRLFRSGKHEMRIRLRPPELGGMRIKVEITNDTVKAALVVDQPHTHALLEQNMSQLFRALQEQGLKVDTLSVEIGSGSEEFGLGSESESYTGGQGQSASRSSEPWSEIVPDTIPSGGLVSGLRLLDVMA